MDIGEDPDIPLSIPLKPIFEELNCPICFNQIKECMITPCGHNFCATCILECVNRKHSCPCCNQAAVRESLIKNHHFDRIVSIIHQQKEEASKLYFERLIHANFTTATEKVTWDSLLGSPAIINPAYGGGGPSASGTPVNLTPVLGSVSLKGSVSSSTTGLNPIEAVFHRHMKRSLGGYLEYFNEIEKTHQTTVLKVKNEFNTSSTTDKEKEKEREMKLSAAIANCDSSFEHAKEQLIAAYDAYLGRLGPGFGDIPVTVTVLLPSIPARLDGIVFAPTDTLRSARDIIKSKLSTMGHTVASWSPVNIFVLKKGMEEVIMHNEDSAISIYKPMPGDQLIIKGDIQLVGKAPPECFTLQYTKNPSAPCDYFSCKDCKINWICKNCAEECHTKQGHTITTYLLGHKATWACCYCPKHQRCKILNNKNSGAK